MRPFALVPKIEQKRPSTLVLTNPEHWLKAWLLLVSGT
jgi:hypothetical protein